MSHDKQRSADERLVYMANQIAAFFASQPEAERAPGVADHINRFWEPRMRRRLLEIADGDGAGLTPLVLAALPAIRRPQAA